MRRHKPTAGDVILSRADRAGIHSIAELARRSGIPRSTMYERLKDGTWLLSELKAINRVIRLEDEDLREIMED